MYKGFDPNMLYVNMKVSFKTVYIMLSQSYSFCRFQNLIF